MLASATRMLRWPASSARACAMATCAALKSTPVTAPSGPTCSANQRSVLPVPQPRSATCAPRGRPTDSMMRAASGPIDLLQQRQALLARRSRREVVDVPGLRVHGNPPPFCHCPSVARQGRWRITNAAPPLRQAWHSARSPWISIRIMAPSSSICSCAAASSALRCHTPRGAAPTRPAPRSCAGGSRCAPDGRAGRPAPSPCA